MKPGEVRDLSTDEISARIEQLQEEIFRLRFRRATMELENPMLLRTIKRDIEFMRDRFGAPIAWDRANRAYYYTHHCDLLPLLRIDADEALALALARNTFAAWRGSPLGAVPMSTQVPWA